MEPSVYASQPGSVMDRNGSVVTSPVTRGPPQLHCEGKPVLYNDQGNKKLNVQSLIRPVCEAITAGSQHWNYAGTVSKTIALGETAE